MRLSRWSTLITVPLLVAMAGPAFAATPEKLPLGDSFYPPNVNVTVEPLRPITTQGLVSTALTKIESKYPDLFAYSEAANGSRPTRLHLTGEPPAALMSVLSKLPVKVDVLPDAKWTAKMTLAATIAAANNFYDNPAIDGGGAGFDDSTGVLTVHYTLNPGYTVEQAKTVVAMYEKPTEDSTANKANQKIDVQYIYDPDLSVDFQVMSGGTALGPTASGGGPTCTAAFTATRMGQNGVLTADHCIAAPGAPGYLTYENRFNLSTGAFVPRNRGDGRFMVGPDSISNNFVFGAYGNTLATRPLTGASFTSTGDAVCSFGEKTRTTRCTTVCKVRQTVSARGVTYNNLVSAYGAFSDYGDSGGPWWLKNSPYTGVGLLSAKGNTGNGCGASEFYSDLISVSSAAGVTLKVS